MATAVVGECKPSRLFYVRDKQSGSLYLVDTGAMVSCLPVRKDEMHCRPSVGLRAVNGTSVQSFGERTITVHLGCLQPMTWTFQVAKVPTAILGFDFLKHFSISVNTRSCVLIHTPSRHIVLGSVTAPDTLL